MKTSPDTSLYVHIPFCTQRCSYCSFFSSVYNSEKASLFISALKKEISTLPDKLTFTTLYIGGGTPTALPMTLLDELLDSLLSLTHFVTDAEKTIEANPETLTSQNLLLIINSGINRLSMGFQSLNDDELKTLGRLHDSKKAYEAFMLSREAGCTNINIDLIFGIPGQTLNEWKKTLNKAVYLNPEHISTYGLTVDEGTVLCNALNHNLLELPFDDTVADMYEYAIDFLTGSGYVHYEISNFSKPGYECLHNLHYWNRGFYYGLGPGAYSFINERRFSKPNNIDLYSERIRKGKSYYQQEERLDEKQALFESIFLGLRKREGIHIEEINRGYHVDIMRRYKRQIEELCENGLIEKDAGFLRLTGKGMLLSNEIFCQFIDY